jgi:hypothetical protein
MMDTDGISETLVLNSTLTWLIARDGFSAYTEDVRKKSVENMGTYSREEVPEGWRKLHNPEHHNFCPSTISINTVISRRMRWVWRVTRIGQR